MIIIGDSLVPFEEFYRVLNIDEIKDTKANSLLFFGYNEELLRYCYKEKLNFFVYVSSIKEGLYASSLNSKYIVCSNSLAKQMQKIADNYMFDTKVLRVIYKSDDLEEVALEEIDGAIYNEALKGKN